MPRRRKTPSTLKDLIQIRARADGELKRLDALLKEIRAAVKRAKLDRDAADRILNRIEPRLDTGQIKPIAGSGRYPVGALTGTIRTLLQGAAPEWVSTTEICITVEMTFGLSFVSPKARQEWMQNSLTRELRVLNRNGLIERKAAEAVDTAGCWWRWKSDSAGSLEEMRAAIAAQGEAVQMTDAESE